MQKVLIISIMVLLVACGTTTKTTKTTCINEKMKDLTLRWGGHNYKTNTLSGWQIDGSLNVFTFIKDSLNPNFTTQLIGTIDSNKFCEILSKTKKLFVEIQALNSPGDSSHFVEYIHPSTNTNLRAVWNMRFKTFGSTEFRQIFDTLNDLINNEKYFFPKKGLTPDNSVK